MKYDVISSGSKGNATLVFSKGQVILLDFGISKRRIEKALKDYGFDFDSLSAVFITHNHSDHVSNAFNVSKEKLYASTRTLPKIEYVIEGSHLLVPFEKVQVGCFTLTPLPISHDAPHPVAFLVEDGEESLVYRTDTGFVPEKDFPYLVGKTYYIFESNHDPKRLFESTRPDYLIRRITSDKGHLANCDAGYYLSIFVGESTKEVVLAHLSDECNTPDIALETVKSVLLRQLGYVPECRIVCANDRTETKGGNE